MTRSTPKQFLAELGTEIFVVTWTLYKIMIPTIAVVKVLEELGLLIYLSQLLSPATGLIGLPESMGIGREARGDHDYYRRHDSWSVFWWRLTDS